MNALVPLNKSVLAPQLDYFLIDGSSSMSDKWWEMLAGLDEYMKVLKSMNIASHGIVHTFDSRDLHCVQRDSLISTWDTFIDDPIGLNSGMTPLYDAINLMGRRLADLDPPNACIIIVTDGEENCSSHTDVHQAHAILDWCRAKGWQVVFLGADFNNSRQAKALGADESNTIGVRKMLMKDAGKSLGEKRARHARAGTDITFTEDERKTFGGYLTGPSNG